MWREAREHHTYLREALECHHHCRCLLEVLFLPRGFEPQSQRLVASKRRRKQIKEEKDDEKKTLSYNGSLQATYCDGAANVTNASIFGRAAEDRCKRAVDAAAAHGTIAARADFRKRF